ncbi:unnamed protein product [Spirodela intermedia]|uniref:Uncharacterized protein n=1 Tax=Spirodela intermedia TaxID=51605 RepID=A0A7I8LLM5_SPIIN|nr:unnamed protein product [Spirodela intermedia]
MYVCMYVCMYTFSVCFEGIMSVISANTYGYLASALASSSWVEV